MIGYDFLFDFPQAAYLLLFVFLFIFLLISLFNYRTSILDKYTSHVHIKELLFSRSRLLTWIKSIAWIVVWICLCIALMDPKGNVKYTDSNNGPPKEGQIARAMPQTVVFLVDTSSSMDVLDGRNKLSRLENAKAIMQDVVARLEGQNVALYSFTTTLTPIVPPTLDYFFTRIMISNLLINEGDESGGTNLTSALQELKEKALTYPSAQLYTLIILSDGGDNAIEQLEGTARHEAIRSLASAISDPQALNLHTYTIGLGSLSGGIVPRVVFKGRPVNSALQEDVLKEIAQSERGVYFRADDYPIRDLAYAISQKIEADAQDNVKKGVIEERSVKLARMEDVAYDLYYKIPLGIALVLLMMIYILPDVYIRR